VYMEHGAVKESEGKEVRLHDIEPRRWVVSIKCWPLYRETAVDTNFIQVWVFASKSNIAIMQRYLSKLLRTIVNTPWYVTNHTLHSDLQIPCICTVICDRISKHRITVASHPNPLMEPMLHPTHNRRLKRRWTFDQNDWGGIAGC
jgi:hypothetical protein